MRRFIPVVAVALLFLSSAAVADDKAIAEFYGKRTVTIAVGFSPGGNYDLYARLVSRHIGKHIPGNPTVIVQNMPGAGSRRLANTLANVGPHDGTMIGLPNQGIAMDQALGTEGVKFDARKFNWIGSPIEDNNVFWGWHTNPVKTIEDARAQEFVVGATGPGSPTTYYPRIMNELLGTKFKVVSGYPGSNELDFAIEKEEVGGRVVSWTSLKITSDWIPAGKANRHAAVRPAQDRRRCRRCACCRTSRPTRSIARSSSSSASSRRWAGRSSCRRACRRSGSPPSAPAFAATMKDPGFLDDARRARLDVEPLTGEEIADVVARKFNAPDDVRAVGKKVME